MRNIWGRLARMVSLVSLGFGLVVAGGIPRSASADANSPMALVYLSGFDPATRLSLLDRVAGRVDVISPDFFTVKADGSLSVRVDDRLVRAAHDCGLQVVPFVGNDWNRDAGRQALAGGSDLARQLADLVVQHGLDGIIVDIENLTASDRDELTSFVRALRGELPASKQLGAAVPAVLGPDVTGWEASYDDPALASLCDYLTVMTYDESVQGSDPGPVAGGPWVEKSVQYMLTRIPRDKFLLGVPLYGRRWVDGSGGDAVSFPAVSRLVAATGVFPAYDPVQQTMHLGYDAGGAWVDVYYDNRASIAAKLSLVSKYHLRGGFAWSLGQEDPSVWDVFRSAMSGVPFPDIAGSYARPAILQLWKQGWVRGKEDGLFHPDQPVTRAESAAMVVRALHPSDSAGAPGFTDVPPGYWAYGAIHRAQAAGWVRGMGNGCFEPDRSLTRAEGAAMIARAFGLTASGSSGFPDLAGSWADGAVAALRMKGIVTGWPDGFFHPDALLTRGDLAVMVARAMGLF
ncbi:MAG: S-layer homology domain-containing protein [Kyrpidia sp.]|nr:S-layer homology domain-containing protein [Kyrpidia sp.]